MRCRTRRGGLCLLGSLSRGIRDGGRRCSLFDTFGVVRFLLAPLLYSVGGLGDADTLGACGSLRSVPGLHGQLDPRARRWRARAAQDPGRHHLERTLADHQEVPRSVSLSPLASVLFTELTKITFWNCLDDRALQLPVPALRRRPAKAVQLPRHDAPQQRLWVAQAGRPVAVQRQHRPWPARQGNRKRLV